MLDFLMCSLEEEKKNLASKIYSGLLNASINSFSACAPSHALSDPG